MEQKKDIQNRSQQTAEQNNDDLRAVLELIESMPVADLGGISYSIQSHTQKAYLVMQKLRDPYFGSLDPDRNARQILDDFEEMGYYCGKVADYIATMQRDTKRLQVIANRLMDIKIKVHRMNADHQQKNDIGCMED